MVPELIKGIIVILLTTLVVYPVSSTIADVMVVLMGTDLVSTIVITIVRYIGFFIGIFTALWIYRGIQPRIDNRYYGVPPQWIQN